MNKELYKKWIQFIETEECRKIYMDAHGDCDCEFNSDCNKFYGIRETGLPMSIKTIDDNNTNFDLVELRDDGIIGRLTPHCKNHGAMNKVSKFKDGKGGYWRCNALGGCRAGCIEEDLNE